MTELSGDSGWLIIWNDIKNGGFPLFLVCVFLCGYFIKPYVGSILSFVGKMIKGKIEKNIRSYTKNDILNHQIFKDLQFWLDIGISSLKINNINVQYPLTRVTHKDTESYLKAKEDIAKDVLTIKFQVIKEYLDLFFNENPLDDLDLDSITSRFEKYITKCEIKQYNRMLEEGIPNEFLKKYYIYERMALDLLKQNLHLFLDDKTFDMSALNRLYLMLNTLNNYLTESYNTILFVAGAINGDLNGVEYKGNIIGEKKQQILQPPHSSMLYPAKELIEKVRSEFGASRATVLKYFERDGNLYHSAVYEVCDNGVKGFLEEIQDIPSNSELEVLKILKQNTIIAVDISKFNNSLGARLSLRGIDATIMTPIFDGNEFTGVLALDYLSLEEFNAKDKKNIDEPLKNYAKEVAPYISYPTDYKY